MRYYEEMQSKWGFADGDAVPAGIEAYRRVYLITINFLAAYFGSGTRAVAYNRPGMHNSVLILTLPLAQYDGLSEAQRLDGFYDPPADCEPCVDDDAYNCALEAANDMFVDDYVEMTAAVEETRLHEALTAMVKQDMAVRQGHDTI